MLKEHIQEKVTVDNNIPTVCLLWVYYSKIMKYLKRNNWIRCLILNILTFGMFSFYIAKKLKVYEKEAWYSNVSYWVISFLLGIIPALFLFIIFNIEICSKVCEKLSVPFQKYYTYPYIWILFIIVPVFGWALFIVFYLYIHFWYIIYLKRGYGEKYIKGL